LGIPHRVLPGRHGVTCELLDPVHCPLALRL